MELPIFSELDRRELLELGLCNAQIEELERHALPICRAMLSKLAPITDVRTILADTLAAITKAKDKLDRFVSGQSEARMEARVRLEMSLWDSDNAEDVVQATVRHLDGVRASLEHAIAELPNEPRRHRIASIAPVRRLNEALLQGFVNAQDHSKPMPPYLLHLSSSPDSVFRKVVGICYRALGANEDPERAIKEYVRWRKTSDRESRLAFGIPEEPGRRRRARGTIGQKPRKK